MDLNINVNWNRHDVQECMMAEEIRHATQADDYLNVPTAYVINIYPSTIAEVKEEIQPYWPFSDDMGID